MDTTSANTNIGFQNAPVERVVHVDLTVNADLIVSVVTITTNKNKKPIMTR